MKISAIEERLNQFLAEGKMPTKCRLHPNTLVLIIEDFHTRGAVATSLREAVDPHGVVQLDGRRTTITNALVFVEDDTVPEGEITLE